MSRWTTSLRTRLFLFVGLILFLAFAFYGARSLRETSEARYGEVAREMLARGDWIVPHLHGKPHLTKPPLAYWFIALGMKVGGVNEWGARLALPFAFLVIVGSLSWTARSMGFNVEEAMSSGLIFATSGFGFTGSFVLTSDPFLTAAAAAGVGAFWHFRRTGHRLSAVAFWLLFGLAFLIKGPPAWLNLIPVAAVYWRRRASSREAGPRVLLGLAMMLAVGLSWFIWMAFHDPLLIRYFLVEEFVNRIATDVHGRSNTPLLYPAVLIGGLFPWVFLVPAALKKSWSSLHQSGGIRNGIKQLEDWKYFCGIWLIAPWVIFSISQSRMPLYVLPLLLPLSLALGKLLPGYLRRIRHFGVLPRCLLLIGAGCWILVLLFVRAEPDSFDEDRAFRKDAEQLAPALAALPTTTQYCWALNRPKHGLGFYLNQTIVDNDLDHADQVSKFLKKQTQPGEWLLIIRKTDLSELEEQGVRFHVVAESDRFLVVSAAHPGT